MNRLAATAAGVVLAICVNDAPVAAQMHGYINYPAIGGVGVKLWGDYGRGLNEDAYKSNYFGGRAELGLPILNVWAGLGSVKASDELAMGENSSQMSYGGGASLNLIKGPLAPVRVSLQAGLGHISEEGAKQTTIPFGLAAAFNVATSGVGIVPWAYAFAEYNRLCPDMADASSKVGYGISGGIELNLIVGLGFYAAVDWSTVDFGESGTSDAKQSALYAAAGLSYKISVPSLGM